MSLELFVTDQAKKDVLAIAYYLAEQSGLNASDRFLNAATQAYRRLSEMPGVGAPRDYGPEFPDLRLWPIPKFTQYLIFYRVMESELRIERVINGTQNVEQIFNPPKS